MEARPEKTQFFPKMFRRVYIHRMGQIAKRKIIKYMYLDWSKVESGKDEDAVPEVKFSKEGSNVINVLDNSVWKNQRGMPTRELTLMYNGKTFVFQLTYKWGHAYLNSYIPAGDGHGAITDLNIPMCME